MCIKIKRMPSILSGKMEINLNNNKKIYIKQGESEIEIKEHFEEEILLTIKYFGMKDSIKIKNGDLIIVEMNKYIVPYICLMILLFPFLKFIKINLFYISLLYIILFIILYFKFYRLNITKGAALK